MKFLLLPDLRSVKTGGPSTFQKAFSEYLHINGYQYTFDNLRDATHCLIINGSRRWFLILQCFLLRKPIAVRLGSRYRSNLLFGDRLIGSILYFPRLVSIHFAILFAHIIIFQSETVKKQWSKNLLAKGKKKIVIYNASPDIRYFGTVNNPSSLCEKHNDLSLTFNLVTLESTHPPKKFSLPYAVYNELQSYSIKFCMHIIGNLTDDWSDFIRLENVICHGHIDRLQVPNIISKIYKPIFIPSDNITGGCPNSLLELQSLGVPAIVYNHTPSSEIIELTKGGFTVDCTEEDLRRGRLNNLSYFRESMTKTAANYQHYAKNATTVTTVLKNDEIFSSYLKSMVQ